MEDNLDPEKKENKEIITPPNDLSIGSKKDFPNTKDSQSERKLSSNPDVVAKANETKDNITKIPRCFKEIDDKNELNDCLEGLKITGYFLKKNFEKKYSSFIFRNELLKKLKKI